MAAHVLLLDASWRIDRVIDAERACELLFDGKAIQASEEIAAVFRSPSTSIEIPSVIALVHTSRRLRVARTGPYCSHRRVRLRDHHECQFVIGGEPCCRRGDSVDHLTPRSLGGPSSWTNLVTACRSHNGTKADRTLDEMHRRFGWSLRREPFVPSHALLIAARLPNPPAAWQPFLAA